MGTRSRIGLEMPNGNILSVYHHWDGYPEWLGRILNQHYNKRSLIADLIMGGDMSSCYSDTGWDYDEKRDPQPCYYSESCLLYTSPSPRDLSTSEGMSRGTVIVSITSE